MKMQPRLALALALSLSAFAAPAGAVTYKIDPVHTQVIFRIGHLELSGVYGRFNDISGTFELDDAGDLTAANASVGTASIDTHVQARDDDVRDNYIHAAEHPTISYQVTQIRKIAPNLYRLTGDFKLHGTTKRLAVLARKTGEGPGVAGEHRVGAEASFRIKRSDYGMSHGLPGVGDDVLLLINIEGIRQ